jgi:hypothetical protein
MCQKCFHSVLVGPPGKSPDELLVDRPGHVLMGNDAELSFLNLKEYLSLVKNFCPQSDSFSLGWGKTFFFPLSVSAPAWSNTLSKKLIFRWRRETSPTLPLTRNCFLVPLPPTIVFFYSFLVRNEEDQLPSSPPPPSSNMWLNINQFFQKGVTNLEPMGTEGPPERAMLLIMVTRHPPAGGGSHPPPPARRGAKKTSPWSNVVVFPILENS